MKLDHKTIDIEAESLTTVDALAAIHNAAEVAYGDRLGTYLGTIAEQIELETARLGRRLLDGFSDEQFAALLDHLVSEVGAENVDAILKKAYASVNGEEVQ